MALHIADRALRDRLFHRRQDAADAVPPAAREKQQMDVLRHDRPCPKVEGVFLAGELDRVDHPLSFRNQLHAVGDYVAVGVFCGDGDEGSTVHKRLLVFCNWFQGFGKLEREKLNAELFNERRERV